MKHAAAFYTHNKLRSSVLAASLASVEHVCAVSGSELFVSAWEKLPTTGQLFLTPYRNNGHLNLCVQVLALLYKMQEGAFDWVTFCEHDCLYPPTYFDEVKRLAADNPPGITNYNYIGLNASGYLAVNARTSNLYCLSLPVDAAIGYFEEKVRQCVKGTLAYIEPENQGSYVPIPFDSALPPVVHVNMDMTDENHHLTNHYNCFAKEGCEDPNPYWGDYRKLGLFTEEETKRVPIMVGGYSVVLAVYECIDHPEHFAPARRFIGAALLSGRSVRVNNGDVGADPHPGKRKRLHLTLANAVRTIDITADEGSTVNLAEKILEQQ